MPANIYPLVVGDTSLKSCRHRVHQGDRRVAAPSMCLTHPRTCMTCCSSRLKRNCGLMSERQRQIADEVVADYRDEMLTRKERDIEMAKINRELGFPEYTEAQLAEDAERRTQ